MPSHSFKCLCISPFHWGQYDLIIEILAQKSLQWEGKPQSPIRILPPSIIINATDALRHWIFCVSLLLNLEFSLDHKIWLYFGVVLGQRDQLDKHRKTETVVWTTDMQEKIWLIWRVEWLKFSPWEVWNKITIILFWSKDQKLEHSLQTGNEKENPSKQY